MSSDKKTFRFSKSGPGRAEVPPERGISRSDKGLRYKPSGFRSPARDEMPLKDLDKNSDTTGPPSAHLESYYQLKLPLLHL